MKTNHPIADEVLELAAVALSRGEKVLLYNDASFLLEKEDVRFFKTPSDAVEFAVANYGPSHQYELIRFSSIEEVLRQISPHGYQGPLVRVDPDANGLYNKNGDAFTDALIDHWETRQTLYSLKQHLNDMTQENLKFLTEGIKYAGFGDSLKDKLEASMREGKPEFQLQFSTEFGNKPFEATLNFRKSESSDMYFFNSYRAGMERNNGERLEHTFYLNKGRGITAKEAFNLLDGRSVHKDFVTKNGEPYRGWVQLQEAGDKPGFKLQQFHEKYGYDLKEAVGKFPVVQMNDPENAKRLIESLQKGNIQSVTLEKDGASHKMFLEADPKFKTVKLYDEHMKLVTKEGLSSYQSVGKEPVSKSVEETQSRDKKKEVDRVAKPGKKQDGKVVSLLPKKRENNTKGLNIA